MKNITESLLGNTSGGMRDEISQFCAKMRLNPTQYSITDDNTLVINKNVVFDEHIDITEIPVKISKINGILIIKNSNLTSFKNFPDDCKYIEIIDNDKLESIKGIPVANKVVIEGCKNLKSLDGLKIADEGSLSIKNCGILSLVDINNPINNIYISNCNKLQNLSQINSRSININNCNKLKDITGNWVRCTNIRNICINSNEKLTEVMLSLPNMIDLVITNNSKLTTINIEAQTVMSIDISRNASLETVHIPEKVFTYMNFNNNSSFEDISQIKTTVRGNLNIYSNKRTFRREEVLKSITVKGKINL